MEAPFFGGFVADLASRKVIDLLACEYAAKYGCYKSRSTSKFHEESHGRLPQLGERHHVSKIPSLKIYNFDVFCG